MEEQTLKRPKGSTVLPSQSGPVRSGPVQGGGDEALTVRNDVEPSDDEAEPQSIHPSIIHPIHPINPITAATPPPSPQREPSDVTLTFPQRTSSLLRDDVASSPHRPHVTTARHAQSPSGVCRPLVAKGWHGPTLVHGLALTTGVHASPDHVARADLRCAKYRGGSRRVGPPPEEPLGFFKGFHIFFRKLKKIFFFTI